MHVYIHVYISISTYLQKLRQWKSNAEKNYFSYGKEVLHFLHLHFFCFVSLNEDRNSEGFLRFIILLSMFLWIHMNNSCISRMGQKLGSEHTFTSSCIQWEWTFSTCINIQVPHLVAFILVLWPDYWIKNTLIYLNYLVSESLHIRHADS